MSRIRFHHFAWGLLVYCLPVILWGAFVRASKSGDGCGSHWPLCDGAIIPQAQHAKTWVEYAHRLSSGILLPLSIVLVVWAFRAFGRNHRVRIAAIFTLFFMCTEGLIGAKLVISNLVADNASLSRAIYMSVHLLNTFVLLAALTLTAWWGSGRAGLQWRGQGAAGWLTALSLFSILLLGVSGAVTALGDTLFPAKSLAVALSDATSPMSHFLIRLRLWHPALAIGIGFLIVLMASSVSRLRPAPDVKLMAQSIGGIYLLQLAVGLVNARLQAPIPLQLIHLLLADLLWINMVCLTAAALAQGATQPLPARREVSAAWPLKSPSTS